jgi:DNA replication protein DnaC
MERRDLLEITEGRYDGGASVIASQCPIPDWYAAIGDQTIADAICDRLLHTAYRLELRGDSMRKKQGEIRKEGG